MSVKSTAYFIDTSALARLYHAEIGSTQMNLLVQSSGIRRVISQLSVIEIESVLAIKVRTKVIAKSDLNHFRGLFFADLENGMFEVVLVASKHFILASNLVRLYATDFGLRTLDALQLSVALKQPGYRRMFCHIGQKLKKSSKIGTPYRA